MEIKEAIEGLNKCIEDRRQNLGVKVKGHLVLQKTILPCSTYKAYKQYEAVLWYTDGKDKYTILKVSHIAKALTGQEDIIEKDGDIKLCLALFKLVDSELYNAIIQGLIKEDKV